MRRLAKASTRYEPLLPTTPVPMLMHIVVRENLLAVLE
jgi:hypothetical protein